MKDEGVTWLTDGRVNPRAWIALLALAAFMITASVVGFMVDHPASELMSDRQLVGTLALYVLLPSYLIAGGLVTNAQSAAIGRAFATSERSRTLIALAERPGGVALAGGIFGLGLGVTQNDYLIYGFIAGELAMVFVVVLLGGLLVWTLVGFVIAWRIRTCIELWWLGRGLNADLLHRESWRPFGSVATANVVFIAGAVALQALQSLDAEFRWVNYEAGSYVGLVSTAFLFWLPLDGLRRRMRELKRDRLAALAPMIAAIPPTDVVRLETALQHRDRISSAPTVPVDLTIASRIVASIILPPLAWVAAALVENWVDRF